MKQMNKKLRYYFANYRFNSLFFKNLRMLLLLAVIPIIGAICLAYYAYAGMMRSEMKEYGEKIVSDVSANINGIIREAQIELLYFGMNSDVELFLYDKELNQYHYRLNAVNELMKMPRLIRRYAEDVYIYSVYSGYVITPSGVVRYDSWNGREVIEAYLNQAEDEKKKLFVTKWGEAEKEYFTVFCNIVYGNDMYGVAVLNMDIPELLKSLEVPDGTEICIADEGRILIASDSKLLNQSVDTIAWYQKDNINLGNC